MDKSNKAVSEEAIQSEWEQIKAAQSDPTHFRPIYNKYYPPIFRFVFRRTVDEALTADLCSQVFLKALQKIAKYEFKGVPFSAWLYRIASNEVAQYFRESAKNRMVSLETEHLDHLREEMEQEQGPQRREAMIKALDELRDVEVELIEMRFFEKRPFKEIADILGLTESNAKIKTYRTLEKMKKIILRNSGPGEAPSL
ncbi:MAG: sigma-70 family RNA polymerase sigma factor [Bacteroidota bacterium]